VVLVLIVAARVRIFTFVHLLVVRVVLTNAIPAVGVVVGPGRAAGGVDPFAAGVRLAQIPRVFPREEDRAVLFAHLVWLAACPVGVGSRAALAAHLPLPVPFYRLVGVADVTSRPPKGVDVPLRQVSGRINRGFGRLLVF